MATKAQAQDTTNRLGRSVQPEARDIYHRQTKVLDLGLHLGRKRSGWEDPKPEASLAEAVQKAVRSRLPLRTDPKSYRDYDKLADDYTGSIELLRTATEDVRRLVETLVEVNCTYTSAGPENGRLRQSFWEEYYGTVAKKAVSSLIPPAVMLSAELEGMVVEIAAMHLCERLDAMVERFGKGVADAFAELQSAELVGRVDWRVPTACDSFYYEDTVLHEHIGREVTRSAVQGVDVDSARMVTRVRQEVHKTSKDRHVVRHGLHLKVVGNAKRTSVRDFPDVIPGHVLRLLKTMPEWLCELTELVQGKTRTDIVVARDIYVEELEATEIEMQEWEQPSFCPLVTVGDYVLTGWGAREVEVESARQ